MINLNLEVFKEPKGFIKLIQILFIIITLASICSFHGSTIISVVCNLHNQTESDIFPVKVYYPFKLNEQKISFKSSWNATDFYIKGDFESSSQYAVFIAAVSMVYCVAALVIYLVFNDFIYQDPKIRKADFVIEAVLTFLWLVVAIAWSDVVSKLKYSSSAPTLCSQVLSKNLTCSPGPGPEIPFGGAYIGIIAGFTTFALMLCGLWFLWKETLWFQKPPANVYSPNDTPQGDTTQAGRPYY